MRTLVATMVLALALAGAASAEPIGAVEDAVNQAFRAPPGAAKMEARKADPIVQDEAVSTGAESALELRFADGTVFTLGQNAQAVIDTFVYTPAEKQSAVTLVQGAFRYVSGSMPKQNVQITTPTVTIGIRGTDLKIGVGPDGTTRIIVVSGLGLVTPRGGGAPVEIPAGNEITIGPDGSLSPVQPARGDSDGEGKIGDLAIDDGMIEADQEWAVNETDAGSLQANLDLARSRTLGLLNKNTSAIGTGTGVAALETLRNRGNDQPPGTVLSDAPIEGGGWQLASAGPYYSEGLSYGPIVAPDGGLIYGLNNNGTFQTRMSQTFVMGANQRFFSIEGLANFVTTEYPTFVGTGYNDSVTIILTTQAGQQATLTLAQLFAANVNSSVFSPVAGLPAPLAGWNPGDSGGQTGWSRFGTGLRVAPGSSVTMEIVVDNLVDTQYPSTALTTGVKALGGN